MRYQTVNVLRKNNVSLEKIVVDVRSFIDLGDGFWINLVVLDGMQFLENSISSHLSGMVN